MASNPYRVPSGMIDFTAISRGRRNRQLEQQADEIYNFNADQRQRELEQRQWDRQASDYLAPLIGNRQAAVDAGVSPVDFYLQQREQMLADTGYQALDPQAQTRALNQLQQSALVTAQQAQQRGDLASANRLMEAFGVYPANTAVDLAAQSGNAGELVQAIQQQYGSDLGFDPSTNTVMIGGQRRPVLEALPNIYRSRSVLGAYPAAGQALQTQLQLQQALELAGQQRQQQAGNIRLQLLGELAKTGDPDALRTLQQLAGITPASLDWSGVTGAVDSTAPLASALSAAAGQPAAAPGLPAAAPGLPATAAGQPTAAAPAGAADAALPAVGSSDEQLAGLLRALSFGLVGGQLVPSDPMLRLVQMLQGAGSDEPVAASTPAAAGGYTPQPSGLTPAERVTRIADLERLIAAQTRARTAGLPFSDSQWRLQAELQRLRAEEANNGSR